MNKYEFTVTFSGEQIHAHVMYRGVFVAARTFGANEPMWKIREWCDESSLWTRDMHASVAEDKITYDHTDGKLHLTGFLGTHNAFDPNDDEALARLVRLLKRRAPAPGNAMSVQPTIPNLPIPSEEDMARRTILTQIGIPAGVEGYRPHKVKQRYQQPAVSAARTQEIASGIIADFFGD